MFKVEHLFLIKRGLNISIRLSKVSLSARRFLFHVCVLSWAKPKYLTVSDVRTSMLFREMLGHIPGLSVNTVCINSFWHTLIRYFFYTTQTSVLDVFVNSTRQLKDFHLYIKWFYRRFNQPRWFVMSILSTIYILKRKGYIMKQNTIYNTRALILEMSDVDVL